MFEFLAHSANIKGQQHQLKEHLLSVARLARDFAKNLGAPCPGYYAGLWHDLGKFHPEFQAYLRGEGGRRGPNHSSAGTLLAAKFFEPLAFLIAGHHGGLPDLEELKARLKDKVQLERYKTALQNALQVIPSLEPEQALEKQIPSFLQSNTPDAFSRLELFLRLLFSCLVDADYLDTEKHFDPQITGLRQTKTSIADLWTIFAADQDKLIAKSQGPLNQIRREIYEHCCRAATLTPGFFSLTVPTGGGKTRSGMAFALLHALHYQKDRIIVAIPYTSIIEQTADVYRNIFGDTNVLEHHSAVAPPPDPENLTPGELWARLASENWDAGIIVTTTVQLFESLFSDRSSSCRKLHNLANSVVILDEVQTLPVHLLEPVLDVLQQLVRFYGVTAVLCSATQPALEDGPFFRGLPNVREIIPEPQKYFAMLKRVNYRLPSGNEKWSWEEVAGAMRRSPQALAVVNTKQDALALLDALDDPGTLHLSTLLCGAHRRKVLQEVRRRLSSGRPCRLVATQVVEAGVDLDFPLVLRAIGPLDRIVQAAGRCNREGKLQEGRVIIFNPGEGRLPPGSYKTGTEIAATMLVNAKAVDLHDPGLYRAYFQRLYQSCTLDVKGIQASRSGLNYPEVAQKFRMIEQRVVPVIVNYRENPGDRKVEDLIIAIRQRGANRQIMRLLQPYIVNINAYKINSLQKEGVIQELTPGLYEWLGGYDEVRGVVTAARDPEELVF
ncbi:CRISPR-associated helicase Cas3' [Moorella sulfitireducens (nom. illeg.)]|uniref:CRISPR-associated helicase Cas3' n=1 Tax=Neomoorella sulfitireducens TaxID=2972948 RepID=UPI0021ABFF3B|nr:CRISPR-associated helicase Cas3' [Moorella sulfitireducens]